MQKIRKYICTGILLFSISMQVFWWNGINVCAEPAAIEAPSAVLLESSTGKVIFEQNARERRSPASITKIIYHSVAQQLNSEGGNVERNMRYAVHRAWDKCDKAVLARYFGEARAQDKEPPSNREFCAALVEYLRQEACRL